MKTKNIVLTVAVVVAVIALMETACARNNGGGTQNKASETGIVTNDNGSVSRTYVESTISTNGNMVTEHRRETRTTLDTEGNMLATSTSEYAQSYPVGDVWGEKTAEGKAAEPTGGLAAGAESVANDSFMGLKFGEVFGLRGAERLRGAEPANQDRVRGAEPANQDRVRGAEPANQDSEMANQDEAEPVFVVDSEEPTLLRAKFTPKKTLAGFDDYYVFVTPTTHKVAKVYACAKKSIEPGARWRRHYLIEALEKRYQTWARLCSFSRPCYAFDLGDSRYVTACLAGSSRDYETVLCGWDENVLAEAAEETAAIREAARKSAAEKRANRVTEAAEAF